jgi:hypothetical protein
MFLRLDAKMENPALREFPLADQDFLADIERRHAEFLSAALTIWRFGRLNAGNLRVGRPLDSYSSSGRWVRDPLFTLGCRDPVERFEELAAADPRRQEEVAIFTAWSKYHPNQSVQATTLHDEVKKLIDPEGTPGPRLHSIRRWLSRRPDMRLAGFHLSVEKDPQQPRKPAAYRLTDLEPDGRARLVETTPHTLHTAEPKIGNVRQSGSWGVQCDFRERRDKSGRSEIPRRG